MNIVLWYRRLIKEFEGYRALGILEKFLLIGSCVLLFCLVVLPVWSHRFYPLGFEYNVKNPFLMKVELFLRISYYYLIFSLPLIAFNIIRRGVFVEQSPSVFWRHLSGRHFFLLMIGLLFLGQFVVNIMAYFLHPDGRSNQVEAMIWWGNNSRGQGLIVSLTYLVVAAVTYCLLFFYKNLRYLLIIGFVVANIGVVFYSFFEWHSTSCEFVDGQAVCQQEYLYRQLGWAASFKDFFAQRMVDVAEVELPFVDHNKWFQNFSNWRPLPEYSVYGSYQGRVLSTFGQPNSMAGFLAMTVVFYPLLVWFLLRFLKVNFVEEGWLFKSRMSNLFAFISLSKIKPVGSFFYNVMRVLFIVLVAVLSLVLALGNFALIYMTASRGAIFSLILVVVLLTVWFLYSFWSWRWGLSLFKFRLVVLVGGVIIVLLTAVGGYSKFKSYYPEQTGHLTSSIATDSSVQNRLEIWPNTWEVIRKRFFVGYGADTLELTIKDMIGPEDEYLYAVYQNGYKVDRAHNESLDVLHDEGAIVYCLYLLLFWKTVRLVIKKPFWARLEVFEAWMLLMGIVIWVIRSHFNVNSVVLYYYIWLYLALIWSRRDSLTD